MNQSIRATTLFALIAFVLVGHVAAQGQPRSGSAVRDMIIEDSLTPAKAQLRNYVAELRDSLNRVESVQALLQRARASKMQSVVISQGRQLARNCLTGVTMTDLTADRIAPMNTPDQTGDQALHGYRSALSVLREELRLCAHFDSLTMAAVPLDQEKLENIATAAREAIGRYDLIRDALMKLLDITLPIQGKIYH